jgi:AP-4 complex subunit epsilon-1
MSSSSSHLSKDLLELIKAIGDSRSKQEEDKIIAKDCEILKKIIKESGVPPKRMKEYLIRAIYIEMLGHDASFSHLFAVNLTQDKNILNKRVGYLACTLLLNENSEFLILLVASLQKDLQSSNWVEVCMALNTIIKFADTTIMQAVTEPVMKLLDNKSHQIRKKAVMCLYKFYQVDPATVPDCEERMRKLICDYDPSVMAATLPYFKEKVMQNPEKYKDLASPLVAILKQVIEHKLPREYDYHRFPGPWIQVIILEILSILGRDDQICSENMYEILGQCLRRADDTGINIGYAIVYQCLKTICTIYPNSHLIELASTTISRFLSSDSPNLRCTGINGLTLIIQINPNYVMSHQKVIVDCLEENDETLKKNTFELLYKMTNLKNVEVIVDKMMNYLKHTTLENQSKKDILQKITELTERFAPNKTWFIKVMNDLFVNFGDMITNDILAKLMAIINEWESETDDLNEFKRYTIENYATIVENYSVLPESLVKLMAWVIGEYTCKLYFNDTEKIKGIIQMLSYLLNKAYDDEMTKCLLISAIAKINSNINFSEQNLVNDIMERYSREKNTELQQRCLEYKRTQAKNVPIEKNAFTTIEETPSLDFNLSFLNNYVQQKSSGKEYDPSISEMFMEKFSSNEVQLNVGPYAMNSNILSMPTKGNDINNLYDTKDDNLVVNMKNELSVKGEQKWGAEGYKEETKKAEKSNFINTQSISSSSNMFTGMENNGYSNSSSNNERNNRRKKNEEDLNPENQAKKNLMKGLFGGLGGDYVEEKPKKTQNIPKKDNNNLFSGNQINNNKGINLFEGMIKNNDNIKGNNNQINNNNNQNNKGNIDLLGFGESNQDNNINNNNQGSIDLLGDIFGGGNSQNNFSNNNQNQNNNLFDDLSNNNNNNFTSNNDIFGNLNTENMNNSNNIPFTPYNINTDEFGELWGSYPDENYYEIKVNISNPQQFHDIIKSKANFAAVDIINNEAISAANYKNQVTLVHATIEPNSITLLVKCQNQALNQEVATYIMGIFK